MLNASWRSKYIRRKGERMPAIPRSLNILPLPVSAISLIFVTSFFCSYTLDDSFFTAPSRTVNFFSMRHPQFSLYKNIDRGDRDIHASVYLLYICMHSFPSCWKWEDGICMWQIIFSYPKWSALGRDYFPEDILSPLVTRHTQCNHILLNTILKRNIPTIYSPF